MELCSKGCLAGYLDKYKRLSYDVVQYFAAHIVNALEYLHSKDPEQVKKSNDIICIHRDLKPSNILIDENFGVKLTDFATAKILNCKDPKINKILECRQDSEWRQEYDNGRRPTFVGTYEYISPEVMESDLKPHTPMIDIWGLGIIVYELFSGITPFKGATEMLTYQNISKGDIHFASDFPEPAKDFIEKCLKPDPTDRIGYNKEQEWIDYSSIKSHEFFAGVDFSNLDPTQVFGLMCSPKKKNSRSFAAMLNDRNKKINHMKFPTMNKNSEAYSTMDSVNQPKWVSVSLTGTK